MTTTVSPVAQRSDLRQFVLYPYRKYRNDPNWVAPLRISQFEILDPAKNPFWQHARRTLYLARRDGEVVGRVATIDDDMHNRTHGENIAFFGFFEAADEDAARALFAAVENEARALGRTAVRGPANPTMNDGAGFQIDAFDERPYVMMPQNPEPYPRWAEAAGYAKIKDLYTFYFANDGTVPERIERLADRSRSRYQPRIRPADMRNFQDEVKILKRIHDAAWEKNWGNVAFTDAEMAHLANDLKMILEPEMALFLEYQGEPVAVCIAIPNVNQVFARFDGRLLPFGIVHLLRRKRIIDQARLVILGVLPEHRNKGFDLVLIQEVVRRASTVGVRGGECGWTLEDNHAINRAIEAVGGVRNKTYRMVQKEL